MTKTVCARNTSKDFALETQLRENCPSTLHDCILHSTTEPILQKSSLDVTASPRTLQAYGNRYFEVRT